MLDGYLLTVMGLICFLEGLPYFAFPDQLKKWLIQVIETKTFTLRIMGGLLMVAGLLMVWWGRKHGG